MNKWFSFSFTNGGQAEFFQSLNQTAASRHEKVYYKVFTPKDRTLKYKIIFIADEGSAVVKAMGEKYQFQNFIPPVRSSLTRIAGFSADRSWMFSEGETANTKLPLNKPNRNGKIKNNY